MADSFGPKPEIINPLVNAALAKAKGKPGTSGVWDVVRQLGQGNLTLINVVQSTPTSAFDPASLPGELSSSQSVMAIESDKGPLLVAFTARDVTSLLPPGAPEGIAEQQLPALQVANVAGKAPYFGLVIDPGSENGMVIPGDFLNAGLPAGKTNARAKAVLAILNKENTNDPSVREALVAAVAEGPMYTAINKAALDSTGQPQFPVVPIPDRVLRGDNSANSEPTGEGTEVAILFGTSPAEIAAALDLNEWVPAPVRMNDVVASVRKSANLKLAVINPQGPTLQVPIVNEAPAVDTGILYGEPTPEPGPSTEPDGGTREGED